jgi:hypothetical protein
MKYMEIIEIVWLTVAIVGLIICSYGITRSWNEINKIKKDIIRNEEVYEYRMGLIDRIGIVERKKIASYNEMMKSDKPLTDEYWIN